jgi:hypothetical protein
MHYAKPPIMLSDVIADTPQVHELLRQNAPYTPLGGWFRPQQGQQEPTSPMWFQNDWVHGDIAVPGADLFMLHEEVTAAAREFYEAEVVIPHTLYVNLMACLAESGPAHTDNPLFEGRDRTNTPMWLLRTMLWSGLFEDWTIRQATSIWWMNDVDGGGLLYWPDGPASPPQRHFQNMTNTALLGDNHGMFHQVEPVGPFDQGTRLVTASAELAPEDDGSGDWAVRDHGKIAYRAPLEDFRISVLWKAHIYRDQQEQEQRQANPLSLEQVARIFADDLAAKGSSLRLDLEDLDNPEQAMAIAAVYPEAIPVDVGRSIFDALM